MTFIQDQEVFFVADTTKFMDVFMKTASVDFDKLKPLTEINVGTLCMAFDSQAWLVSQTLQVTVLALCRAYASGRVY